MADSQFWQFSLDFYGRPRVAEACLDLQDNAGVDVNVLFFVLYMATHKRELNRAEIERVDASIKTWRDEAVVPLRTLRRKLKTGIAPLATADTDKLRSAVKRLELEAEHTEQQWLERNFAPANIGTPASSENTAAQANLAAYAELMNGLPDPPVATLQLEFSAYVAR